MHADGKTLLERIADRCVRCPDCGKNWLWNGPQHRTNVPIIKYLNKVYYPKREVWKAHHGDIPAGRCVISTCESWLCINPEKIALATKADVQRRTVESGLMHTPIALAKIAMTKRKNSRISDDAIEELRSSGEPAEQVAARLGCSKAYVNMLRKNQCRKVVDARLNPFAGLLAANDSNRRRA